MRKLRKKDRNYVIVFAVIVLALSVGYAYFAQPLAHRLATIKENGSGNHWWDLWWLYDEDNANDENGGARPNTHSKSIFDWWHGDESNIGSEWNIGFTNAVVSSTTGNAREFAPVNYTKLVANFNATLSEPGDSITYDFTVTNSGILDAKANIIETYVDNNSNNIIFTTSGLSVGEVIKAGESKHIKVTATFNSNFEGENPIDKRSIKFFINYVENS